MHGSFTSFKDVLSATVSYLSRQSIILDRRAQDVRRLFVYKLLDFLNFLHSPVSPVPSCARRNHDCGYECGFSYSRTSAPDLRWLYSPRHCSNALVSKKWSNEALSVVWYRVDSLWPLLSLLAPLKLMMDENGARRYVSRFTLWVACS